MKYIKKYESGLKEGALKTFFDDYNNYLRTYFKNNPYYYYDIPEIFHEEFDLLHFLYGKSIIWRNYDKTINNYIKKEVKKFALESIIKKFEDDTNNYAKLKEVLDKRPHFLSRASIKYIFFLFQAAIKKTPSWIKDSNRYNL
jgi:hypothetical protein